MFDINQISVILHSYNLKNKLMRHTINGKDDLNAIHLEESYDGPDIIITIDDEDGDKSITLSWEQLYRLISQMLHIQQSFKRNYDLDYPNRR